MGTDYMVKAQVKNIYITEGDTREMAYSAYLNGVLYDLTGMQLDMDILDCSSRLNYRSLSSAGVSPKITISTTSFYIQFDAFTAGKYTYDIQLTNGTDIMTILKGKIIVTNQITI